MESEDLLKYGIIPEFIGRVPVVAPLDGLTEEAMIEILVKPKNALVKQYKHLIGMEGVELSFTDEALKAVAKRALAKGTGARGLRAILEEAMLELMYDVPSNPSIKEVVITPEVINEKQTPVIVLHKQALAS